MTFCPVIFCPFNVIINNIFFRHKSVNKNAIFERMMEHTKEKKSVKETMFTGDNKQDQYMI